MKVTPENINRIAKHVFGSTKELDDTALQSLTNQIRSGFDETGSFSSSRIKPERVSATEYKEGYNGVVFDDNFSIQNRRNQEQLISDFRSDTGEAKEFRKNTGLTDTEVSGMSDADIAKRFEEEYDRTFKDSSYAEPSFQAFGASKNKYNDYTISSKEMEKGKKLIGIETKDLGYEQAIGNGKSLEETNQALDFLFDKSAGREFSDEALSNLKIGQERTGEYGLGMLSLPTKSGTIGNLMGNEFGSALVGGVVGGAVNSATGGDFESGFMAGGLAGGLTKSLHKHLAGSADNFMNMEKNAIAKVLDDKKSYEDLVQNKKDIYHQPNYEKIAENEDELIMHKEELQMAEKDREFYKTYEQFSDDYNDYIQRTENRDKSYRQAKIDREEGHIDNTLNANPNLEFSDKDGKYSFKNKQAEENARILRSQMQGYAETVDDSLKGKSFEDVEKALADDTQGIGLEMKNYDPSHDPIYQKMHAANETRRSTGAKFLTENELKLRHKIFKNVDDEIKTKEIEDSETLFKEFGEDKDNSNKIAEHMFRTGDDEHIATMKLAMSDPNFINKQNEINKITKENIDKNTEFHRTQNPSVDLTDIDKKNKEFEQINIDYIERKRNFNIDDLQEQKEIFQKHNIPGADELTEASDFAVGKTAKEIDDETIRRGDKLIPKSSTGFGAHFKPEFDEKYATFKPQKEGVIKTIEDENKRIKDLIDAPLSDELSNQFHKDLLKEASTKPLGDEAGFFKKRAQDQLKPGDRKSQKNLGLNSRHMVLGGAALAGGIFGNRKRDHSRGFNSHRGSRI